MTPLPVPPEGFERSLKTFGELEEGDYLRTPSGALTPVTRVYEEHLPETMYRLTFEDKGKEVTIEASGNHLWYVETSVDRSLHRRRLKEGKRFFGNLPQELEEDMLETLEEEGRLEVALVDLVGIFAAEDDPELFAALRRIAETLGPIAEETTSYRDLLTEELVSEEGTPEQLYDARLFYEQVFALGGQRWWKKSGVIVGRVVTTEELLLMEEVDIPVVRPHEA